MVSSLINTMRSINKQTEIDLIIFTGDLVWTGAEANFRKANEQFITPIIQQLNLSNDQFILCPGNHDLSEEKEFPAITEYIDKFNNIDELDSFIDEDDGQLKLSYKRSEIFFKFLADLRKMEITSHLYQTYDYNIGNKEIGIVAFNTAWRSIIGNHNGQLLLPKTIICKALEKLPNKDIYLSLMHHPLEDLKPFNKYVVEDIIFERFHINFSGHYHKKKHNLEFTNDIGLLNLSASATMSGNDSSSIGFSVIDLDVDTYDIQIDNYSYIQDDNIFLVSSSPKCSLPMNEEKREQTELLKNIKNAYSDILHEANTLMINYVDEEDDNFLDYFNIPILKEKSYFESIESIKKDKNVDFSKLYESNYIIFGKDKYGKSSLLRKIQLDILSNYQEKQILPIYVDLKIEKNLHNFKLESRVKILLKVTKRKAQSLIEKNKIHFLVDNFNENELFHIAFIKKIATEMEKTIVTVVSEETSESRNFIGLENFTKLFIHPVSHMNIRSHVGRMLVDSNNEIQEEIIRKINTLFTQMNIPFNYWHLSMFLWIYKKEKNININDNVEMLKLYVEKLLERENLAIYYTDIDFDLFLKLLGELAYSFFKNFAEDNYSMSYSEIVSFISTFREHNVRFTSEEKKIIEYLLDKGILKENRISRRYSFRLNGLMEYFLAIYMNDSQTFVDDIINSEDYYLSFGNEIEIYAGLDRKNESFLKKLYDKTFDILNILNKKYQQSPDVELNDRLARAGELAKHIKEINIQEQLPMPFETQDEIMDEIGSVQNFNEDVQLKPVNKNEGEYTPGQLGKYVFILARAFRGLFIIDNRELINSTFDLVLESYINLGFETISELSKFRNDSKIKSEEKIESEIIDIISCIVPLFTQLLISEAILHKNLKRLLEMKLDEYEKDSSENQYKLLVIYFMILDISLDDNLIYIERIIENITIPALQNICILKLLYILLFKINGNKSISDKLKKYIVAIQLKINPKSDKSKLMNKIEKEILKKA